MVFLRDMEEILMLKPLLKLRDKPAEDMQRRKLDSTNGLMKSCTFNVKTASKVILGFRVNTSLYRKRSQIVPFSHPIASVPFLPSGNLLFRDEAEELNGRLSQVSKQSCSNLH